MQLKVAQAGLQLVHPVASTDDDADEGRRSQHLTATEQERPRLWIGCQPAAGQRARPEQASLSETPSHWFTQFRPEQSAELPGSQSVLVQLDDACTDRLAMQSDEEPCEAVLPVITHRREWLGELDLHHPDREEPVAEIRRRLFWVRCSWHCHMTGSLLYAVAITGLLSTASPRSTRIRTMRSLSGDRHLPAVGSRPRLRQVDRMKNFQLSGLQGNRLPRNRTRPRWRYFARLPRYHRVQHPASRGQFPLAAHAGCNTVPPTCFPVHRSGLPAPPSLNLHSGIGGGRNRQWRASTARDGQ